MDGCSKQPVVADWVDNWTRDSGLIRDG